MLVKLKVFWSKIHFLVRISWFLCGSIPPQNTSQTCYVSSCHCIENLWGQLLVLVYQSVPAQVIRYCDHPSNPLSGSPPSSGSNMSYNTRTVITPHYSEILLNPKLQILYSHVEINPTSNEITFACNLKWIDEIYIKLKICVCTRWKWKRDRW